MGGIIQVGGTIRVGSVGETIQVGSVGRTIRVGSMDGRCKLAHAQIISLTESAMFQKLLLREFFFFLNLYILSEKQF